MKINRNLISPVFLFTTLLFLGCGSHFVKKQTVSEVSYFDIQNAKIAYITYGEGEPLIMCMGYGGNMDLWDERFVNLLKKNYKVIVFDYRGMGFSTNTDSSFTMQTLADDVNELYKVLEIDKAHILGWSMGGYVAQTFAINYPEKVNKLILYATDFGDTLTLTPSPEISDILADANATPDEMTGTLIPKDWLNDHPNVLKAFSNVKEPVNPETVKIQNKNCLLWLEPNGGSMGRLHKLKMPTLVIAGKEDVVTPWENSKMLSDSIRNSTLIAIDKGGHGLMYQYPDALGKYILTFLEQER